MGSFESKLKSNDEKASAPSTPVKSPNANTDNTRISHLDPRSPSDVIFRTPIEIPSHSNEHPTVSSLEHFIDPRSPSDQFERTPIIIKESHCQHPMKLHNKILDNARRNITYSPTLSSKSKKDCDSPKPSASPPKLISSIPTFKKCNEKRKSFVGLLETNIDFTETNLDDFIKTKSLNKNLTISIDELPMCDIVERKNCDPRSPSKDFLRTPIQIVKKVGEVDLNSTVNEWEIKEQTVEKDDCKTESLLKVVDENNLVESEECATEFKELRGGIEDIVDRSDEQILVTNTQIEQAAEIDNTNLDIEKNTEQKMAEIVEDLIGHITTLTTEEPTEVVPYIDILEIKEPIIDLTADVQEFDKKLTKIIHENNENFTFKKIISKDYLNDENSRKRTPMKDRNQISEPKKNKLKVSDKPRKLDYDNSKIPVFREKGAKQKVQCENTAPTKMNIRKKKKSQQPRWDSEKTLVI